MKKLVLAALLTSTALAQSPVNLSLTWDPNPASDQVRGYIVYRQSGTNWVAIGQTTNVTFALPKPLPSGTNTFAVTAFNVAAESPRSLPVTLPQPPALPGNLKVSVTVTIP